MVLPLKYNRSRHLSTFRPFIMFAWTKIEKEAKTGGMREEKNKNKTRNAAWKSGGAGFPQDSSGGAF